MSSPSLATLMAAPAEPDPAPVILSFSLQARAEPGVMPRVLELFAKRGLVPHKWHSTVAGATLTIDLQMGGLDRHAGAYIARCMRQIVGVEAVLTAESRLQG